MPSSDYSSPYMPRVDFDAADLAANRAGMLTPKQQDTLRAAYETRTRDAGAVVRWFLVFFGSLVGVGAVVEFNRQDAPLDVFVVRQGPIIILALLAGLGILGLSAAISARMNRRLSSPRVSQVEGVAETLVKREYSRGGPYMRYELRLKRGRSTVKLFRLSSQGAVDLFQTGTAYRVYYVDLPQLPILLSVERIAIRQ